MEHQRLIQLSEKLLAGTASAADYSELADAMKADQTGELASQLNVLLSQPADGTIWYDEQKWQAVADRILLADKMVAPQKSARIITFLKRTAAAAAIIVLLGAGIYFLFLNQRETQTPITRGQGAKDVSAPSQVNAVLTLSNGEAIILDSVGNGVLSIQAGANVKKLSDGSIHYDHPYAANGQAEIMYNVLSVPRGSRIVGVTLSDGTKVWLNSESSLRYPVVFSGNERKVELTGEGYFEVSKNATMPFYVASNNTTTKVLGTSFNINGYNDEPATRVTLIEGAVNVSAGSISRNLIPGQQAEVKEGINVLTTANIEEVLAWKNGRFAFYGADIRKVMRELARWYDMEVVYTKEINEKFYIEMTRNTNVSNVFKILEETGGVHFKIEGKKITVMP